MIDIAVLWDQDIGDYRRYLRDQGFDCDVIPPVVLNMPVNHTNLEEYRLVIVPAGFGNMTYTRLLPELRAIDDLITEFVKAGGTLFVGGALSNISNAYDWLPVELRYVAGMRQVKVKTLKSHRAAEILHDQDECICDGYFTDMGEDVDTILSSEEGHAILVTSVFGAGEIIVTSIHEFPSREFLWYCVNRVT